nr:MAG TPA: hypothetical protein [Crassvirales sp.]
MNYTLLYGGARAIAEGTKVPEAIPITFIILIIIQWMKN